MAERTIVLNAKVDTGNSAKDLKDVDSAMNEYKKGASKAKKSTTDLNQTFEDVYGDMKPLSGRLGELEDRMYELALAGDRNTKEFKELQREAVKYRKTIIETDAAVDGLSQTGSGISAALELSETAVAGYQGFVGVTTLLGNENEELLETITKLQAAQGVLSSLQQARLAISKKSLVMTKANAIATRGAAAAQGLYAVAVGTSTGAMKALRIIMLASGIGLIIGAIGFLIANFDKLTGWIKETINGFDELGETTKAYIRTTGYLLTFGLSAVFEAVARSTSEAEKETKKLTQAEKDRAHQLEVTRKVQSKVSDATGKAIEGMGEELNQLDLLTNSINESGKSRKEINQEIKDFQEEYPNLLTNLDSENTSLEDINRAIEDQIRLSKLLAKEKAIATLREEQYLKLVEQEMDTDIDVFRTKAKVVKGIEEEIDALDNLAEKTQSEIDFLDESNDAISSNTDERKTNSSAVKEQQNAYAALMEKMSLRALSDEGQELNKLQNQLDKESEIIKAQLEAGKISEEKAKIDLLELENWFQSEKQKVIDKYTPEESGRDGVQDVGDVEEEDIIEDPSKDPEFIYEKNLAERIFNLKKGYAEREAEFNKMTRDEQLEQYAKADKMRVDIAANSFGAIMEISKAFAGDSERQQKRAFKIQKAAGIAQALVQTYQAAQGAYLSQISVPTPDAPVRAAISAGIATATGLANVASIASQKFEGGGGGGGGGATAPSRSSASSITSGDVPQQDSVQLFGQANEGSNLNLGSDNESQENNVTVTAQVVESEITTAQNDTATNESRFSL